MTALWCWLHKCKCNRTAQTAVVLITLIAYMQLWLEEGCRGGWAREGRRLQMGNLNRCQFWSKWIRDLLLILAPSGLTIENDCCCRGCQNVLLNIWTFEALDNESDWSKWIIPILKRQKQISLEHNLSCQQTAKTEAFSSHLKSTWKSQKVHYDNWQFTIDNLQLTIANLESTIKNEFKIDASMIRK